MMDFQILPEERSYLRTLAQKQATYAALPVMEQRRQRWYALNDGQSGVRPPVVMETWTFDGDFLPDQVFHCTSPSGRTIERQLLQPIRNHELINDDKVTPDTFDISWFVEIDEYGIPIEQRHATDLAGRTTGFEFLYPITDLKRDFDLLKPAQCRVDRAKTFAWKAFLEELFGDLLPVRIRSGTYGNPMLTLKVVSLMGMESFFMAMYDTPDEVHRLMAYLRDNTLRIMRWAESEQLLCVNNENQPSFGSSYNFTHHLSPSGPATRLADMWGAANSQETVGISPAQFREFCFPYYRDACAPFGLLYYGCCEPTHTFWEDIRQLPHLKKVSINRWTDQQFMADALRGSSTVFSRKPDPNLIGLHEKLDEAAWTAHIRETLQATRGVSTEIIIRDVYTVHGNLNKPRRAVALAQREIDRLRS